MHRSAAIQGILGASVAGGLILSGIAPATAAAVTCGDKVATIVLGGGDDDVIGTPSDDVVVLGGGDDYFHGDAGGHDVVCGGPGNDDIRTGTGNDTVFGGSGNDIVANGTGRNRTSGGSGLDELDFDVPAGVRLDLTARTAGGGANDTFTSVEIFQGTQGDDVVRGSAQSDTFRSSEGRDRVWGDGGDDFLSVAGSSVVRAGRGADLVFLEGTATAYGGDGGDRFLVSAGSPRAHGQQGADYFSFQALSTPRLDGGDGQDRLNLATLTLALSIDLAQGTGLTGLLYPFRVDSVEQVVGTHFADTLSGDRHGNRLAGRAGNDTVSGRGGGDVLLGGLETDLVDGGDGSDRCEGETVTRCER